MSQKETTDSPTDSLPKLAEQARQAYEQKRTKDCLELARAILSIDPHHDTAQWLLSSIESEMQRDLKNTRVFFRTFRSKDRAGAPAKSGESPFTDKSLAKDIFERAARFDWRQTFTKHPLVLVSFLFALSFVIANFYFFLSRANTVAPVQDALIRYKVTTTGPDIADAELFAIPIAVLGTPGQDDGFVTVSEGLFIVQAGQIPTLTSLASVQKRKGGYEN